MGRFYAHYQNTTVSALEVADASNCYQRRVITDTGLADTARTKMLNDRASLSSSVYGTLEAVNRNGTLGRVMAVDNATDNSTTVSGTNLYTNSAAIWPSDPRVRPTEPITIANSTAVSPVDAWSVASADVAAARQGFINYMAVVTDPPASRMGLNPWRTLASIWHDHAFTYFAWDDFTPGQLQGPSSSKLSTDPEPVNIRFAWSSYQFLNDRNPNGRLRLQLSFTEDGNPGNTYTLDTGYTVVPPAANLWYDWQPNGTGSIAPGTYQFNVTATLRDAVITTHFGANTIHSNFFTVT